MVAQIGADGLDLFGDPRPELLADVARILPEPGRKWIDIEGQSGRTAFRSTQRLWISDVADGVAVATWPAELARQARYLYGSRLGSALVAAAIERGWTVEPSPHIAYYNSPPGSRLYMHPPTAPLDYVAYWEDEDSLRRLRYAREDVEHELWPWLKQKDWLTTATTPSYDVSSMSFSAVGQRICARAFDSAESGHPRRRPSLVPGSLRPSATSSMPCSLVLTSRR